MNFVSIMPPREMRARIDRYKEVAQQHGGLKPSIKMGMNVFIVVGDTDAEAKALADRAYKVWHHSFHYLYHLHGRSPVHGERVTDFAGVELREQGIAGSPQTVIDGLAPRIAEAGTNYLVCQLVFGDMTLSEALRSVELFGRHVMPALQASSAKSAVA
jgi:alkanesulfonate monooxygenase SsuD/methylene tetrahydromethanopterin reductase-like flavin-dependent oxidoreductase (luciferase family)